MGCLARGGAFAWPGSRVHSLPVPETADRGSEAGASENSKGKGRGRRQEGAPADGAGRRQQRGAEKGTGKGQLQEVQAQSPGQTVTAWKAQLLKDVGDGKQLLLRLSDTPCCGECGS